MSRSVQKEPRNQRIMVKIRPVSPLPLAINFSVLVVLISLASPASAHHGRDFLLSQSADLPHPGEFFISPRLDYVDGGEEDELEFEPTLLVGGTDWIAFEVHGHVAKEGSGSWEYESTAPAVHLKLTPAKSSYRLGLTLEYELSHDDHHADNVEGRLVISKTFRDSLIALNIVAEEEQESGAELEWGYSVGFRRAATEAMAWGLEAQGSLEESEHEVLVGLYFDTSDRLTLNVGVGTGLSDSEIDLSIRTALIWHVGGP